MSDGLTLQSVGTSAIINNGTVQLGVNPEGHLNVEGGTASSGTGTTVVGLRYMPTNADAISPGCWCEGWGAADAITGVTGHANRNYGAPVNITVLSFTSTSTSATSVVQIGSTLKVSHVYQPAPQTPYLYEVKVTLENVSNAAVDARYRRVMDWDVEPTAFSEYVTARKGTSTSVLFSSDDGFGTANPLGARTSILFTGDADDSGPTDHGALFDFGFGTLAAGATKTFTLYYGAAANEPDALNALAAVGMEGYSLGQPSTADGPTLGTPNTFILGFKDGGTSAGLPAAWPAPEKQHNPPDPDGGFTSDPVHTLTGSFTYTYTDLALSGRGPAPVFARSYNSNDPRVGPLGPGWTHSYDTHLESGGDLAGSVLLVGPQGRSDRYSPSGDGSTFVPPAGVQTQLRKNASGTYTATHPDQGTWTFNSGGLLTAITDRFGNQSTLTYNANGQLTTVSDPANRHAAGLSFAYDTCFTGRLCSITDWANRVVRYEYDANGRLWKVIDRENQTTTFGYEGTTRRLTTITDARGNVAVTNTYDANGRVATQKDAKGLTTGQQTDLSYVTNADRTKVTTVTYPATSFDATWRFVEEDHYNAQGQLTKRVSKPTATSAEWSTVEYTYTTSGFRSSVKDARGNTTTFCYDVDYAGATIAGSRGNLTRIIDPAPATGENRPVTLAKYDAKNNLLQVIPPKGVGSGTTVDCATNLSAAVNTLYATDLAYDASQTKLVSVTRRFTDPDLTGTQTATTKLEYGDAANPGVVTKVIPPRGNTGSTPDYTYATSLTYFGSGSTAGLLESVTDALGNKTTYGYDTVGRRTSMVDPLGNASGGAPSEHTWTYAYDAEDRLRVAKAPAPAAGGSQLVTESRYDAVGNRIVLIDPQGQVTKYLYDERDSLQEVQESPNPWIDPAVEPSGKSTTAYAYDHQGNLSRVLRAKADTTYERATDYAYDGLGRLRKETQYPSWPTTTPTLVTESTYDLSGNQFTVTDPLGQTTTFGYDALNRLTSIDYSDVNTADVAYQYDAHGNRTRMTDGTGATTYQYDEVDRLLSVTSPTGTGTKTVGYRYDRDGNRTKLLYSDGTAVTSSFDKGSRLESLLDWANRTTSYSYLADGSLKRQTNVNGTTADYTYDHALRLKEVWHQKGTDTLAKHASTLDALGNRTHLAEVLAQVSGTSSIGTSSGASTTWTWGRNVEGQLGRGWLDSLPVQVSGLTGVGAIQGGWRHSLAVKTDGTVWTWGDNQYRQLGDGTTVDRASPVPVSGLSSITAVSGGQRHSLARKQDGTVWAWGYNNSGQLGDGTTADRSTPVQVVGAGGSGVLTGINAVEAGGWHSLALKSDGTVWIWGAGSGNSPAQVSGLSSITALAAGQGHSLALKSDGTVWAWGDNGGGQLGDGTTTNRSTPVQVVGPGGVGFLTGITALAAGGEHSLALGSDGTVYAWGANTYGQLGDGTNVWSTTPVGVSGLASVVAISAADPPLDGGGYHSLARTSDGSVWAWGRNDSGQLGSGTGGSQRLPVRVQGLTGANAVAGGGYHSLALKSDGTVWAWGWNFSGQLGRDTAGSTAATSSVLGSLGPLAGAAGGAHHSLARKPDGTVWGWGNNTSGQLGDGTTTSRGTPVQVSNLTSVTQVAGGDLHSLALKPDGTVSAWGYNSSGQLGDGSETTRTTPVSVSGLTGVTAIAAGGSHSVAVKSDGTVWAWGRNSYGQLGDGTWTDRTTPVQVSGLTGVTAVAAGTHYTLARKSDGTVWAWGRNHRGQLGDGTTTTRLTPVQVGGTSGLSGIEAIAAGHTHGLARTSAGTLWAWGRNADGQLGDGTAIDRLLPVQVSTASGLTGATAVAAGALHSLALKPDGSVWAWGSNAEGQAGDRDGASRSTPRQVSGPGGAGLLAAGGYHSLAAATSSTRNLTSDYTYDRLSRLTDVAVSGARSETTQYQYDPVGNRRSRVRGGTPTSYDYDRADRLTLAGGVGYSVNANGNLTARGSDTFLYDQANRLTSATISSTTTSYTYDGDGKRVSTTAGSTTTRYVYDVNAGLPVLLEDGTRKYVWGLGLAYAVDSGGAIEVYHTDGLGSVRALTDASGVVVQTYETDEFGIPVAAGTQGSKTQPFGYTGEQRDAESGFVYLRARMYDPQIGRFLQRDPFAGFMGLPLSLNRFTYVENNPINFLDPSGLASARVLGSGGSRYPSYDQYLWPPSPLGAVSTGFGLAASSSEARGSRLMASGSARMAQPGLRTRVAGGTRVAVGAGLRIVGAGLTLGGFMLSGTDAYEQQRMMDQHRTDLSHGQRELRAIIKGGAAGTGTVLGGLVGAAICAPAATTGAGVVAVGICGAAGGYGGDALARWLVDLSYQVVWDQS